MRARKNRPLLLIDIAVPRDIEPEVNFMENIYLYNIDDLQTIAADYLKQRKEEIARCEAMIAEKARALLRGRRPGSPPLSLRLLPGGQSSCGIANSNDCLAARLRWELVAVEDLLDRAVGGDRGDCLIDRTA